MNKLMSAALVASMSLGLYTVPALAQGYPLGAPPVYGTAWAQTQQKPTNQAPTETQNSPRTTPVQADRDSSPNQRGG